MTASSPAAPARFCSRTLFSKIHGWPERTMDSAAAVSRIRNRGWATRVPVEESQRLERRRRPRKKQPNPSAPKAKVDGSGTGVSSNLKLQLEMEPPSLFRSSKTNSFQSPWGLMLLKIESAELYGAAGAGDGRASSRAPLFE